MGTSLNGLTPAGTYPGLIKTGDNAPIDGTLKTLSDGNGNNLPMSVSTTTINLTGTAQVGGVAIANTTQLAAKQDTLVSGTNIKTINGTSVLGSGNIVTPTTSPSGVAGAIQFSNGSAFASDAANLFWDDTNNRLGIGTNAPSNTTELQISNIAATLSSNANLYLSSSQTSAGIKFWASGGSFANMIQSTQGAGGVSTYDLSLNPFGGNIMIGVGGARLGIKGSGSTSATTSLLVQNSAGDTALQIKDDREFSTSGGNVSLRDGALFIGSNFLTTYGQSIGFFGAPVSSAIVEMQSTTRGFLPPRMTTIQRDAIATPATGLKVYNTTTNTTDTYDGTTWQKFGQQTFIKGSGTTSATSSLIVANNAGTTALEVLDDSRVKLGNSSDFTVYSGVGVVSRFAMNVGSTSLPTAQLQVKGSGSTSATTSLLVQNSSGTEIANFRDDSSIRVRSEFRVLDSAGNNAMIMWGDGFGGPKLLWVNGSLGVGVLGNNASAILQADSTTQGFLPPRMTTTQKNAIATPAAGLVVYDSTTNKLCCYNGSTWNDLF